MQCDSEATEIAKKCISGSENTEMAYNQRALLILVFFCAQMVFTTIGDDGIDVNQSDYDRKVIELILLKNADLSNIVSDILSFNWTENQECLIELNAIKNGLTNHQKWAAKGQLNLHAQVFHANEQGVYGDILVIDAWGHMPSGILNGISIEYGSFSQCFHIVRNGTEYKTQYCTASVMIGESSGDSDTPRYK